MGNLSSSIEQVKQKKIIIVGASYACKILTQNLQDLDPQEKLYEIL